MVFPRKTNMKVLLLTAATILGDSAICLPLVTSAPAVQNNGGKCTRCFHSGRTTRIS